MTPAWLAELETLFVPRAGGSASRRALLGAEAGGLIAILLLALVGAASAVTLIGVEAFALLILAGLVVGAGAGIIVTLAARFWDAPRTPK